MGIIEKQATKNALYSYLGAGLGFLTIIWLSHLISPAENGVIRALISYNALFAQFANLGFVAVTIRLFPYFRDKDKGHNGFLFYAIIVSIIGFFLCWIVFSSVKPELIKGNQEKSPLFVNYLFYLMPLTLFTVFFNIFDAYLRAGYNSVIGSLTKDFLQRILILAVLALYFLGLIDFNWFMFLYVSFTCLSTLMLLFYIIKKDEWHIKPVRGFMSKDLRNEMLKLSFFSMLAGGASAIILNIDSIMVNHMLGEEKTGIYGIAANFGTIMLIPARSLYRVASSIVAEKFKSNSIHDISLLYKQSCNNQFTIGMLLFIGIWANLDNIMLLLPEDYSSGKNVILILSAGYLIEMATGINQVILSNSRYFRFEAFFVFLTVGLTVLANYLFIPIYGITGSAIATALTMFFGNSLRFVFLYRKYNMQPYDSNNLKIILIGCISFLPGFFLPELKNLLFDIFIRSSLISGIFILLLLKLETSPELNNKIRKNWNRYFDNKKTE